MFKSGGISECEEGAMRCDVNISVRQEGVQEFGVRSEIKNMSSFDAIERAINYEAQRHMDALEFGTEELVQETRRFDDVSGKTFAMRNKETEADYRYFPDPNLMPIVIDDQWLEQIKANKPVALDERAESYAAAGISDKEIAQLLSEHQIAKLLDDVVALGCNAKEAAAWILTDCAGILRKAGLKLKDLAISADELSFLIKAVNDNKLNRGGAKKVLIAVIEQGVNAKAYCDENGLLVQADESMIDAVIDKAIESNTQAVADYKAGKEKALMAIFGACMKELKGSGDPQTIRTKLIEKLKG